MDSTMNEILGDAGPVEGKMESKRAETGSGGEEGKGTEQEKIMAGGEGEQIVDEAETKPIGQPNDCDNVGDSGGGGATVVEAETARNLPNTDEKPADVDLGDDD